MVVAYDGTHYAGWQIQPNGLSVQALIQARLAQVVQQPVVIVGASRTDAGVHARGQTAHFSLSEARDTSNLTHSLNCLLPPDIRILQIEPVHESFHARYGALGKCYSYTLCTSRAQPPFSRFYQWHYPHPLQIARLQEGAQQLIGTHDFTSFANSSTQGSASKNPIRTLTDIRIVEEPGLLRLEFFGNGFLYKMVRNIVSTLIESASGKPYNLQAVLAKRDRRSAGATAPAQGLCLEKVFYSLGEGGQMNDSFKLNVVK